MTPKGVVLTVLGTACVAAAGVGGFLALRMNSAGRAVAGTAVQAPAAQAALPAPVVSQPAPPAESDAVRPAGGRNTRPAPSGPSKNHEATSAAKPEITPAAAPGTSVVSPPVIVEPPVTFEPPPPPPLTEPPPPVQEPAKPQFEELTIKQDSVIGIRLDTALSSDTAHVEDKVHASVTRNVVVAGRTAIPAGARLEGTVTSVDRGGKFKGTAQIAIRFTSLILSDNTRMPIQTETITRSGQSPGSEAAAKMGASAVVGTIIGTVIGGKKGAAIGAGAGAAGGTAAVAAGDRNAVTLAPGTPFTVHLTSPITLLIDRDQS